MSYINTSTNTAAVKGLADKNITSVEIKSNVAGCEVTRIDRLAFYGAKHLAKLFIPDSVVTIGTHAFCGCESLTHLVIPSSVKSIGEGAFYGCSSLDSIFIPKGLINMGKYAFDRCKFPQEIREQLTARFGKFIFK